MNDTKKVIFIMSEGHSGSTLLELILGSHTEAFALGEIASLTKKISINDQQLCGICAGECSFWNSPNLFPVLSSYFDWNRRRFYRLRRLHKNYGSFVKNIYRDLLKRSGSNYLIDSSKEVWWLERQLRPFWNWRNIKPVLIYMYRDGRAVLNSMLRKYPDTDVRSFSEFWKKRTIEREQFFSDFSNGQKIKVSYENLTTDPVHEVKVICNDLDLEFEPGMLAYWEHDHHIVEGNLGTRFLIFNFRERFENQAHKDYWSEKNQAVYQTEIDFYTETIGLAIKPDMRWRDELSRESLTIFESVSGKLNNELLEEWQS